MKLALTLEVDCINVQALNMGRIVVDIDGIEVTPFVLLMNLTGPLRACPLCCPERHTLQYRTYHGNGQRLAVLAVASDQ